MKTGEYHANYRSDIYTVIYNFMPESLFLCWQIRTPFLQAHPLKHRKMDQFYMFSSGQELANLVVSSELLHRSWDAISGIQECCSRNDPTLPLSVAYKVYEYQPNVTIIAFDSSPSATLQHLQREGTELVSSDELPGSLSVFDFIRTKVNPSFSINKSVATIFATLLDGLSIVKEEYGNSNPLIITGHSMGGSIASLFTLWLLGGISPTAAKLPLCVTFGSPLLGDNYLQKAISERPSWNSCFLHVVSYQDRIPKFFTSPCNVRATGSISQPSYMPFGTFLLCSESDCACFEEPESVLELMEAFSSNLMQDLGNCVQITDYGRTLELLKCRAIRNKASSHIDQSILSPFQAGIVMQLEAIGIKRLQPHENVMIGSLIANVWERVENFLLHKRKAFDPTKKLNDIKIDMIYLEWYKKVMIDQGGYYDSFKNRRPKSKDEIRSREEIVKRKRILTQYWKSMVVEVEKIPQKEMMALRTRWLYAGTNCRRMIEPLEIAEYYSEGKRDYLTQGRSKHYILLERWFNEDKQPGDANLRKKACSLTEDSCFWAHVEEAIISCKVLKDRQSSPGDKEISRNNLTKFEHYVIDLIQKHAVSSEIFLLQSTFMQWWEEYSNIMGSSYESPLTDFMKKKKYQEYA